MENSLQPNNRPVEQKKSDPATVEANAIGVDAAVKEQAAVAVETGAIAEVVAGMEAMKSVDKEKSSSERKGDSVVTKKGQSGQQQDDQAAIHAQLAQQVALPPQKVMIRKIKTKISVEVKEVKKQIKKFQKKALKYARELAEAFQHLRNLRNLLRNIATFAIEFLQMLYEKVVKKESLATVEY